MGRPTGFEPATPRITILCSNQLSYGRRKGAGNLRVGPGAVNPFFRSGKGGRRLANPQAEYGLSPLRRTGFWQLCGSSMERLRIVTYNIAHGRGLQPIQGLTSRRKIRANLLKIAKLLRSLEPDVVALQEIDQNSLWAGSFDQLEFLREFGGFPYAVFGVNNRRAEFPRLNYGNAILSRHPITEAENIKFGRKNFGEKGFLFAEIEVRGRRLPVVNMHLHYRSRATRIRQVEHVMDYLNRKHPHRHAHWLMPPIVCGDMNNPSHTSDATASLFRYFARHGHYTLHPRQAATFPSPLPQRTLDFIFLPPACVEVYCLVVKSYLSDHRPVMVEFKIN
jgi:endonuclease/exonuclease/phosphatase family metal-dependent hydrolase